jgi:DNA-binding response OmpR family regulator
MSAARVLVVEDVRAVRILVAGILSECEFVPVLAATAEDAVRIAAADRPDVALIDETLPGMSGMDLIRWFRSSADVRLSSVPLIGLSGFPSGGRALMDTGACCMVWKPVGADALVRAVRWALEVYVPRL